MTLLEFFGQVEDPRRKQGTRYKLQYVLLFCVLSVLSGATGYATMALWMKMKHKELNKVFGLKWKSTPKKTCLSELFMSLDKAEVEKAFRRFTFELAGESSSDNFQIIIDGKTIRGSFDNLVDTEAMNLISIFLAQKGLILAHIGVENKDSEMVGVRDLLEQKELIESLKLSGVKVITMDALHCQKKL
jgi:predicted transposase YbfD/YdcC